MPKLSPTYFDFDGGRGEPARLALSIAGIEFEDRRIPPDAWPGLKSQMPYGAMPVLEVDGRQLTQSNAINRYVGKLTNLYPTDPWQAALCDEVMDAVEDIGQQIVVTFPMKDAAENKAARERLAAGRCSLDRYSSSRLRQLIFAVLGGMVNVSRAAQCGLPQAVFRVASDCVRRFNALHRSSKRQGPNDRTDCGG